MDESAPTPVSRFLDRLRETDIANIAGFLSRWGTGRKAPHARTQLPVSHLTYVVTRLGESYRPDKIRAWLLARHPQLDGERAINLIHGDRSEAVLAILDRLDADTCL